MGLGEMGLGELGLGEMGLGEMGQNRSDSSSSFHTALHRIGRISLGWSNSTILQFLYPELNN